MKKAGPKETIISDPLSADERRSYDNIRWAKNEVEKLPDGFSLLSDGRSGRLYFRDRDRFIEIYLELAGDPEFDVIVDLAGLKEWVSLDTYSRDPVPPGQQCQIQSELETWLRSRKIRYAAS